MLHCVALVRTDVSEELSASIVRVTRIGELGTSAVTNNRRTLAMTNIVPSSPSLVTLMMEALSSSETLVLTRATWRNIPEDDILQQKAICINSNKFVKIQNHSRNAVSDSERYSPATLLILCIECCFVCQQNCSYICTYVCDFGSHLYVVCIFTQQTRSLVVSEENYFHYYCPLA
jgi:hypothetical protein